MKHCVVFGCVSFVFAVGTVSSVADDKPGKGSDKPWYNIFKKRYKNLTVEEERLQKFWHDYYDSLRRYYAELDHMDWNEYFKKCGHKIKSGTGCPDCKRIPYAPVTISPSLQWAVPGGKGPDVPPILQKK
jgi:hypothetical protein